MNDEELLQEVERIENDTHFVRMLLLDLLRRLGIIRPIEDEDED